MPAFLQMTLQRAPNLGFCLKVSAHRHDTKSGSAGLQRYASLVLPLVVADYFSNLRPSGCIRTLSRQSSRHLSFLLPCRHIHMLVMTSSA